MSSFERSKERILFLISLVYLFSFSSLYIQLPGLFSRNGILPVDKISISPVNKFEDFITSPNLLRLGHFLQLDKYDSLEIVTVFGILLSLLALIFVSFRSMSTFIVLWLCHFTCYMSGQVFMHFQWDILLLEAGLLTIILARADLILIGLPKHTPSDKIAIFLFKWLLFRLMFASGVVKLTSNCPTWWNLKALTYHFETQCLPTPLAFVAHHLPEWVLKCGVVSTYYIEIIGPLMFFLPFKGIRLFSFYSQVLLQLLIILTGNYNFFNILTIALCYSLLTDSDFGTTKPPIIPVRPKGKGKKHVSLDAKSCASSCVYVTIISHLGSVVLILGSICLTVYAFKMEILGKTIRTEIGFNAKQFNTFLSYAVTYSIYAAIVSFLMVLYCALKSAALSPTLVKKVYNFLGVIVVAVIASLILFSSIDVFAKSVAPHVANSMPSAFARIHKQLMPYQVTNSYGLFRRMTQKRDEVVIEFADSETGPWTTLQFVHKPGNVMSSPPIVTPHQPRLDWQMWFAALSRPDDNPWLYSLLDGILNGRKEVLGLLAVDTTDFKTPKFVRANLLEYKFAAPSKDGLTLPKVWWTHAAAHRVYIDPVSLASPVLKAKLSAIGLLGTKNPAPSKNNQVTGILAQIRGRLGQPKNLHPLLLVILVLMLTKLRK